MWISLAGEDAQFPPSGLSMSFYMWVEKRWTLSIMTKYLDEWNEMKWNEKVTFTEVTFCVIQFSSVAQSCPTLCDPIDGSPSGSPVPGILQARTLEWVAISFSNTAWEHVKY